LQTILIGLDALNSISQKKNINTLITKILQEDKQTIFENADIVIDLSSWFLDNSFQDDATTFLAYNGYLDKVEHTGNSLEFIINSCPNYTGNHYYFEKQCVTSEYLITANGTATLEFAKEIMNHLEVKPEKEIEEWYKFNKNGYYSK